MEGLASSGRGERQDGRQGDGVRGRDVSKQRQETTKIHNAKYAK